MLEDYSPVRQYLVEELKKDLTGPGAPDEELLDRPTIHYLTGILYPQDTPVDPSEDDDASGAAEEDDDVDPGVLMATATNPSSIGLTFVSLRQEPVRVATKAAIYVEKEMATQDNANDEDESSSAREKKTRSLWQRKELILPVVLLHEDESQNDPYRDLAPGLKLYIRFRPRDAYNVVTVSLVNRNTVPKNSPDYDASCFFQPEIEVSSPEPGRPIFLARTRPAIELKDPDRELNDLLYRHAVEFAVGHGCATEWEVTEGQNATVIRTSIIPAFEALQLSPDRPPKLRAHQMRFLSEADTESLVNELQAALKQYQDWIDRQRARIGTLSQRHKPVAARNMDACSETAGRIARAIQMIETQSDVREAFQLANRAMLMQRSRVEWLKKPSGNRPPAPDETDEFRWRHFQLAFMLLCIPSIADTAEPARSVVDLLWFPTGGGKTEAYLGLTAFTIFLRRLRTRDKREAGGVTVLMRYTLRLLTIQQFQRAASLIMACERLRRDRPETLGAEQITLGLWVGVGATPNTLKEAGAALRKLLDGDRVFESNPYQVLSCPWCGQQLLPRHYSITVSMRILCPNPACDFQRGLPLYLVDEDIYQIKPTLLLGTVDKFARLPWKAETSALFGRSTSKNLPPELIIQDELHLISGPLGTLVGLYEVAVDALCQNNGVPAKVIASTATIRRAKEQCEGLFARGLSQFPPPGLDARDSFFAQEVPSSEKPGRLFVGVHAPGKSMKTALLRIYALLLQKIYEHASAASKRDPYWTLVGYFNSLRELGGAVRLVDDDVRARIKVLARRQGTKERQVENTRELNSRVYSDEIPEILEYMAKPLGEAGALDTLLATNMISVGVDIDRLGLMVVTGQPKMTAEYIQATSRIGRQYPGLVVTLYNWTRPRDRSHYERFVSYHSAVYSQVEATSVTPFASRARDRGLHGMFIAMVRHMVPGLNPEKAASRFDPETFAVEEIKDTVINRVSRVDPDEAEDTRQELEKISRIWQNRSVDTLVYGRPYGSLAPPPHLMAPAENFDESSDAFPTLNSLRGVEGESSLFFARRRK